MKTKIKYKTKKGGWKWLRCNCCGEIQTFSSFRKASNYYKTILELFKNNASFDGVYSHKVYRIK
jgi:hypothetical protein